MTNMHKERIEKIDLIRGIAIILVICGHGIDLLTKKQYFDISDISVVQNIIYSFHIPLFFLTSGYVEYRKTTKEFRITDAIIKNIISLYIPFLILNFLYYLEKVVAYSFWGESVQLDLSISTVVKLFYMPQGAAWFFLALLYNKLLFIILNKYIKEKAMLTIFLLLFWLSFFNYFPSLLHLEQGFFLCVGYLIHRFEIYICGGFTIISCVNSIIVGFILMSIIGLNDIIRVLVAIPVFIVLILSLERTAKIKVVNFCGSKSIIVCMVHQLSQYACFIICSKYITSPTLLLGIMILLQILFPYIIYRLFSDVKILNWIEYIFYPYKFVERRLKRENV